MSNHSRYSLVIIRAMTIGRGHGPSVLSDILDTCDVSLIKMRQWVICDTTWNVIGDGPICSSGKIFPSWICLFKSTLDLDISRSLFDILGPNELDRCLPHHVKYKYKKSCFPSLESTDNVLRITDGNRLELECMTLFENFDLDIFRG